MKTSITLAEIRKHGIEVSTDGANLKLVGNDLPTSIVERVKANKSDLILAVLRETVADRLLRIAESEHLDIRLVDRLDSAELNHCHGQADEVLTAYVRCLADTDLREHGKVP